MNKVKILYIIFFCLLLINSYCYAVPDKGILKKVFTIKKNKEVDTNSVTVAAFTEIKYQAESTIKTLESVLNSITFNDNTPDELAGYIKNSFTLGQRSRVFLNNNIIVESDINPNYSLGKNKDLPVEKYLHDLDMNYEKTGDFSIKFSNIVSSNVKKTDHIYIRVRYDQSFGSKFKANGSTYPVRRREAIIRMNPVSKKKWNAFIEAITFADTSLPIDSKEHDMQIISSEASTVENSTATDVDQIAEFVTNGDNAQSSKRYEDALASYQSAMDLAKVDAKIFKKIRDTKRLIEVNSFDNWKSKGDKAYNERDFEDAVNNYNNAIRIKNSESAHLRHIIDSLTRIIQVISKPDNLLKAGDCDGAIKECDKVLIKMDSLKKRGLPELYLVKGLAYQKMAELKGDTVYFDKALENFDIAIDFFPNFKRALKSRANFYENIKINIGLAINDYDSLIRNEIDESPDKPLYYISTGKLKAQLKYDLWPNNSIEDYQRAISLLDLNLYTKDTILHSHKVEAYLLKGKIEYEANRKVEAMNSLNEAIYINDKILFRTPLYNAYFLRGLNNIKLGRLSEALSDIGIAKQGLINISWGEWNQIDSLLSNAYSSDGLKFKEKESKLDYKDLEYEYDRAEKQLELAIQIFKFNANAYYGKAEIRYAAANYLGKRDDIINSQSKYEEAIDLYNKALFYNNNLSDANFKIGLIQKQKGEYEPAIISFNNAIKNDPKNIHILIERAKTFLNQNEYDRAVIDFSLALKFLTDTIKFSKNYGKTPIDSKKILYENLSTTFELTWKKLFLHEEIANRIILDSAFTLRVNNGLGRSSSDYFKKGLIYYKSGIEFQKAANEFSKCIKSGIEDLDPSFFSYYGIAELFNNKDSLAFKLLSYAVIKTESNPLAYYGLGCYYAKKSNSIGYLKAYYCFERAFSLSQALSTQINENDISFMNKTFLQGFLKDELWGELYRLDFELEKELLAKEKIKSTN